EDGGGRVVNFGFGGGGVSVVTDFLGGGKGMNVQTTQTKVGKEGKAYAAWNFRRLGVDFVKEEGCWKLWHMDSNADFVVPPGVSWSEKVAASDSPFSYQIWGSSAGFRQRLRPPTAYETFAETSSYSTVKSEPKTAGASRAQLVDG